MTEKENDALREEQNVNENQQGPANENTAASSSTADNSETESQDKNATPEGLSEKGDWKEEAPRGEGESDDAAEKSAKPSVEEVEESVSDSSVSSESDAKGEVQTKEDDASTLHTGSTQEQTGQVTDSVGVTSPEENVTETGDPEFDWDKFAEKDAVETSASQEKYEELYNNTLSTVAENEVVDGTVISMNKREVVINIGYKSEGVVSLNEFRYNPDLKVGDTVEVYVESQEDKSGQLVLSHKKARALRSWDRVNEANEKDEIIKGYIKCRTKGGMIVDVFGIEAFLPGSQIDVKPIRDYDMYVGKTMEFKVVKINQEFKKVVVSHKALIEAEIG